MARAPIVRADRIAGGWRFTCSKPGFLLFGRERPVPADGWEGSNGDEQALVLLRGLTQLPGAQVAGDALEVPDDAISRWEVSARDLAEIGLPDPCPYRLSVSSERPVADPSGKLDIRWLDAEYQPVPAVRRDGTLIASASRRFLLRDPLRSLVEAVEDTNAAPTVEERIRRFTRVRRHLLDLGREVSVSESMRSMIVYQATALGIGKELGPDGFTFTPELLGDVPSVVEGAAPRRAPLLNRSERARFQKDLDHSHAAGLEEARPSYVIGSNTYAVLDPGVRAALRVVRQVNRSDRATREAFAADRMSFLLAPLEEVGSDGSVVEFGERVIGIRQWEGGASLGGGGGDNAWFPDAEATTYVLRDGKGGEIHVPADAAGEIARAMREAIAEGRTDVEVEGVTYPVHPDMLDDLARIPTVEEPRRDEAEMPRPEPKAAKVYHFVKPTENVEELAYVEARGETKGADIAAVLGLLNEPKQHQSEGIAWMQQAYVTGMRGILMADDMGLGKTFQVLAFLKWLRLRPASASGRKPILVVAPKSLLGNWLDEVELHLGADGLGSPVRLFGPGLRELRLRSLMKGRDIELAVETLDVGRLQGADWILTTYETLRDYQISLARVDFEVVAFDEAQKIKESGAMVTQAARSQKVAGLRIIMTGTPVENGLMDLWTLMDVAWPGRLGFSERQFRSDFVKGKERDPAELRRILTEPANDNGTILPPLMLRRLKDTVGGLPPKSFQTETEPMPEVQATAYTKAIEAQARGEMSALVALQAIRNVSLHPDLQRRIDFTDERSVDEFIGMSARMRILFRILDLVRERDEKALIFVDLRRAQRVVGEIARHRYRLEHLPHVINGETTNERRDVIRKGFQKRRGFELLMLSPRAAGFGLTLHSANHVVHLNRWWNPAVEDQCTDRAHRIGQERDVTVWLPTARHPTYGDNSYDLVLDRLLAEKRRVSRDVIVPVQFDTSELAGFQTSVFGDAPIHLDLANMDWKSFEDWTLSSLIEAGFVANRTPATGDFGADVIVRLREDPRRGAIVQVKHRSSGKLGTVSEREVIDVLRAKMRYPIKDPALLLVTNGSLDAAGRSAAYRHGVEVIDHSRIEALATLARMTISGTQAPD